MDSLGIIWSPACGLFDEIIDDLQDYARVSLRENYDLNTEVRQFIYSVYEGGNRNAQEGKIRSIEQCDSHQICIVKLTISEQMKWDNQKRFIYNANAVKLKSYIRRQYKDRIFGYLYDDLFI